MAKATGFAGGTPVRVSANPGRILIESDTEPTLVQMLAAFDPGEARRDVMACGSAEMMNSGAYEGQIDAPQMRYI